VLHYCLVKNLEESEVVLSGIRKDLVAALHDRMTQCSYESAITTFDLDIQPDAVYEIDVMGENGRAALVKANKDLGLYVFGNLIF